MSRKIITIALRGLMMSIAKRLTEVFKTSEGIPFDDTSRFIIVSDCHRGDNSWADDFAHNQNIMFHALNHYYEEGFTYIEIGDGDELWENRRFEDIREAHSHVFWKLSKFHEDKRLYLIWGNHNRKWKNPENVERNLYYYYDEREGMKKDLFRGIDVHEGLILKQNNTGKKIFLAHGHQGDLLNDRWWWVGRYVVRNIWKFLQLFFGWNDPTRPAKNFKKREMIEKGIIEWVRANDQAIIIGHTHRPEFPKANEPPFFNTGSCVHPRCITGIEIDRGNISLIKWFMDVKPDAGGMLYINKDVLVGPRKLQDIL